MSDFDVIRAKCCRKSLTSVLWRCLLPVLLLLSFSLHASEVTVAGFAFSGDYKTVPERFPYTWQLYRQIQATHQTKKSFSRLINDRLKGLQTENIVLESGEKLVNLKKNDRALMTVLVLTGETVATERYGTYYKTFVNLRGDALIFDYKNRTVIRSYPVSVALFDATSEAPSEKRIAGFIDHLIRREDGRGLVTQYTRRLKKAKLPSDGTRTVQVHGAEIDPEVLKFFPDSLRKNPRAIRAMLTEGFGSVLSAKLNVPMMPASIGHKDGVMSLRLENGDDYQLNVREGDYLFDIKLDRLVKKQLVHNSVGTSYVYGAFMSVRFYEPALNTTYIQSGFKNGEVAVVPDGQISADDFAAYQDAIRGLILKFADAFDNPESGWLAKAASASDITNQMKTANDIIRKCQ